MSYPKLDPKKHRKIHEMVCDGLSDNEISFRTKMSRNTVAKYKRTPLPVDPSVARTLTSVELPAPDAEEYQPKRIEAHGWVLILSDIHVPHHDGPALEAAVADGRKHKPVHILLNGDIIDCAGASSKFLKEPSKVQLVNEVEKLRQFFRWLRDKFPKIPITWKLGNHEARLYDYLLRNAPALFGLDAVTWATISHATECGVSVMEDDTQTVELGKLPVLHGHEFGRAVFSPVNPARGLFNRAKGSALCGHYHASSDNPERDVKGRTIVTWTTGCLCHLRPRYSRFNRWNHGHAMVEVEKDGHFTVHNKRIEDGRVR